MKSGRRPGREAWLILYLPVYLLLFALVERTIVDHYWVSYCAWDARIPFVKEFAYAYVLWYPLLLGMMLWLLLRDKRAFVRYGAAVILSISASFVIFFLFPNGQDLRPTSVPGNELSAILLRGIYAVDTNTNVLPSMHVVGTLAALVAAFDTPSIRPLARIALTILGILINISTVFVKQHSLLDIFAGILLYALTYCIVYLLPKLWKKRRARG